MLHSALYVLSCATERSLLIIDQIAGIAGKVIEFPFDTVKVRLQSQPAGKQLYTGPLDCFRQSWARDGVRGLYRGVSAPLAGAAIETSSLFFSVCSRDLFLLVSLSDNQYSIA